jgi:hypothetical protein
MPPEGVFVGVGLAVSEGISRVLVMVRVAGGVVVDEVVEVVLVVVELVVVVEVEIVEADVVEDVVDADVVVVFEVARVVVVDGLGRIIGGRLVGGSSSVACLTYFMPCLACKAALCWS